MQTGAVAMIDALGFKGIWKKDQIRENPELVLKKLQALKKRTLERMEEDESRRDQIGNSTRAEPPTIRFLSDTIFAGVALPAMGAGQEAYRRGFALHQLIGQLSGVLEVAAVDFPTLTYRGCITLGEFMCEDVFILGEGVDEVASMMNEAEGAFLWLSPRAKAAWDEFRVKLTPIVKDWKVVEANVGLVPYPVPLKNGGHFNTYAVSPFALAVDVNRRRNIIEWIEQSFDTETLTVQLKKQNTLAFLQHASRHRGAELFSTDE